MCVVLVVGSHTGLYKVLQTHAVGGIGWGQAEESVSTANPLSRHVPTSSPRRLPAAAVYWAETLVRHECTELSFSKTSAPQPIAIDAQASAGLQGQWACRVLLTRSAFAGGQTGGGEASALSRAHGRVGCVGCVVTHGVPDGGADAVCSRACEATAAKVEQAVITHSQHSTVPCLRGRPSSHFRS